MKNFAISFFALLLLILIVLLYGPHIGNYFEFKKAPYTSDTYAVTLTTGQTFYGRLRMLSPSFVKLSDVYYFQSIDVGGKVTNNLTPHQASPLTSPENYVLFNRDQVTMIEKLGEDSELLDIISQQ